MNTNQKKLKLIKEGFKASTLQYLSDRQINALFNRLQEQVSSVVEPAKKGNHRHYEIYRRWCNK